MSVLENVVIIFYVGKTWGFEGLRDFVQDETLVLFFIILTLSPVP